MTVESQDKTPSGTGASFSDWLARFLRFLVRLIFVVILGTLLGIGIFYAVPWLYRTYLQPIEQSVNQLEDFQASQEQTNQRLERRINDYQGRLDALALRVDTLKQEASELQSTLDQAVGDQQVLQEKIDSLQSGNEEQLSGLQAELEAVNTSLEDLESRASQLQEDLSKAEANLQTVQDVMLAQDTPVAALRRELVLVRVMEYLTRSRIFLVENNLGTAAQDIEAARDLLAGLEALVPEYQQEALAAIQERVDQALEQLADQPVLAAQDLEVAWQLLQQGLPGEPPIEPASGGTAEPAPTPSPTPRP